MQEQIHLNIQNGNVRSKEEFDLFFQKYYSIFLSFTYRYRLSQEEAEDIVQEVFIHFWEQRFNFSDIISIKVFFYRSIRNRCLNYFKHEEIRERYADSVAKIESEDFLQENIIREEVSFFIREEIKQLPEREQQILILSLSGKSNQEIAEQLSIAIATVKTHKTRAYAQLRKTLSELRIILTLLALH